ncbi:MAG: hypothetical protein KDL87_05935, partial [Verrucomicrobiae bacterium]|nr:hypothetical protein [Verrucomicrobiae bacterium]
MDSDSPSKAPTPRPVPARFLVSRRTLHFDRFMTSAIVFGGIGIVVAVFGIFAFILGEIFPLFGEAKITESRTADFRYSAGGVLGLDEWSKRPFFFDGRSEISFLPLDGDSDAAVSTEAIPLPEGSELSAYRYDAISQSIIVGTNQAQAGLVRIRYTSTESDGKPVVGAKLELQPFYDLGATGENSTVQAIDYKDAGERKLFGAILTDGGTGETHLKAVSLKQQRSLLGAGEVKVDESTDLTSHLAGQHPVEVLVAGTADSMIVSTREGDL